MSIVVVERSFAEPVDFDALQARERPECMDRHRVLAHARWLARDRRNLLCVYHAPDADSVRVTQDENGMPYDRVWSAHAINVATPVDPRYESVMVLRELSTPVSLEQAHGFAENQHGCMATNRCTLVASLLSFDGLRMICRYSAPDAESVRHANTQAGLPVRARVGRDLVRRVRLNALSPASTRA